MAADPLSGNHMMSLDVSVHLYDYMMATLLVFIVSLSLYISTCLSMCFYQFSFPALTRGFLWCETLLHPGKTCDPPVRRPESSGSARSHEDGGGTLTYPTPRAALTCTVTWLLLSYRVGPCEEGKGAGPEPHSHLRTVHTGWGRTVPPGEHSLRFVSALSSSREGENSLWTEPKGKDKVPLLS